MHAVPSYYLVLQAIVHAVITIVNASLSRISPVVARTLPLNDHDCVFGHALKEGAFLSFCLAGSLLQAHQSDFIAVFLLNLLALLRG